MASAEHHACQVCVSLKRVVKTRIAMPFGTNDAKDTGLQLLGFVSRVQNRNVLMASVYEPMPRNALNPRWGWASDSQKASASIGASIDGSRSDFIARTEGLNVNGGEFDRRSVH